MAKQKQTKTASNILLITIIGIAIVAIASCALLLLLDKKSDNNSTSSSLETEEELTNEEKIAASSNDAKDRMEKDEENRIENAKNDEGLLIATPQISFIAIEGDKVAAGGNVMNINETEGTCTYVFTKDDEVITMDTGILPNPSYISCETARFDKSNFTSGTWSLKIKYKSNTAEGESEAQTYTAQ